MKEARIGTNSQIGNRPTADAFPIRTGRTKKPNSGNVVVTYLNVARIAAIRTTEPKPVEFRPRGIAALQHCSTSLGVKAESHFGQEISGISRAANGRFLRHRPKRSERV